MTWSVLIAHAPDEEALAEMLVTPIEQAGYRVSYRGTVEVGDSIELEATLALQSGGPVVLCGTQRAVGSRWAWQLVNAARATAGRPRVFVVQMERDAYVEPLARDSVIAPYWEDPAGALQRLIAALRKHYPPETDTDPPAQGPRLGEIWSQLAKLLRENYRVFHSFGPPVGRLGVDRRLWRKQKAEVITPNNKSMSEILRMFRQQFPASSHEIVDRMLNHLDAYELNREVRIDYSQFTFPSDFSSLIQLGEAGYYRESYDRSGVRLWAAWTLGTGPAQVLQAFMFGSILNNPRVAGDIDIDVLYVPSRDGPESYDQWLGRTKAEAKALFGIPLHLASFQSPKEEPEFRGFLQRYLERAENPRPFYLQPVEGRL